MTDKITLSNTKSGYNRTTIDNNFQLISEWINSYSLSRDNPSESPNQMEQGLDLNSNDIYNVGNVSTTTITLNGELVTTPTQLTSATAASIQFVDTNSPFVGSDVQSALDNAGDVVGKDVGVDPDQVPTNSLLGTAAYVDVGTADTELPTAASVTLKTSATGASQLPVGNTAQRPVTPVQGMIRENSETGAAERYDGTTWTSFGGASGGPGNPIMYEHDNVVSQPYELKNGKNALMALPITVEGAGEITISGDATLVMVG